MANYFRDRGYPQNTSTHSYFTQTTCGNHHFRTSWRHPFHWALQHPPGFKIPSKDPTPQKYHLKKFSPPAGWFRHCSYFSTPAHAVCLSTWSELAWLSSQKYPPQPDYSWWGLRHVSLWPVSLQQLPPHQHIHIYRYSRWMYHFYIEIHLCHQEYGLCYQIPHMSQDLCRRNWWTLHKATKLRSSCWTPFCFPAAHNSGHGGYCNPFRFQRCHRQT